MTPPPCWRRLSSWKPARRSTPRSPSRTRSTGSPRPRARPGPAGVLRDGPRHRRRAHARRELLHRALRRGAAGDQLPVLRRHGRHRHAGPGGWEPFGDGDAAGITAYVLRTGRPLLLDVAAHAADRAAARSRRSACTPVGDWVGRRSSPRARRSASIVVQTYAAEHLHSEDDRDLLAFVGQHIGSALAASGRSRRPASATPSWPSSTRSASPSGASSSSTRSSSSSANACARCSMPSRCSSRMYDEATGSIRSRTRSTRASASRRAVHVRPGPDVEGHPDGPPLRLGTRAEADAHSVPSPAARSPSRGWACRSSSATA